jgi:hypothetical protein
VGTDWLTAVSASQKKYVDGVLHPRPMSLLIFLCDTGSAEITSETNPYKLTVSLQHCVLGTD